MRRIAENDGGTFSVASYNIHSCVGLDGRCDPDRVARVIGELEADTVGLQEVYSSPGGSRARSVQLDHLASATGLQAIAGSTLFRPGGHYGNALLTRRKVLAVRRHDFSIAHREPRGALDVDLEVAGRPLRVFVTHLGLRGAERRQQVKRILEALVSGDPEHPVVVLGDINEWLPLGRCLRWLHERLGRAPSPRTFPAAFPFLSLDRIWVRPCEALVKLEAHRSPLARLASDHLPLKATIATAWKPAQPGSAESSGEPGAPPGLAAFPQVAARASSGPE
jgi:endonuclease/exonuclease/phosphatase family metal-dependent hydrolase